MNRRIEKPIPVVSRRSLWLRVCGLGLCSLLAAGSAGADTLTKIVSSSSQGGNNSFSWSQKGADQTLLPATFTGTTALGTTATVSLVAANSIVSVVCTATPCSWTGTGFPAGHSLLWTSDSLGGSNGPVTLSFASGILGAGATIQADTPGAFTAKIEVFNGATSLGSYTQASDNAGDPLYLGAIDQTGANITKVVFSLTTCSGSCTDFALDTIALNTTPTGAPAVTLSPTSLTFPATAVGSQSAAQVITLTNSGTAALSITSIALGGAHPSQYLTSNTCPASLGAGLHCTVNVRFRPTISGTITASLLVTDNATGSPQSVSLSGFTPVGPPAVTLTPTSLTFPATAVGSQSAAMTVSMKNTGTGPLTITSFTLVGTQKSDFVMSNNCGTTLAAGATCTIRARSTPKGKGAETATISIVDNAATSPQSITLNGTGQ